MKITATYTARCADGVTRTYTATMTENVVAIDEDGVRVGSGRWDGRSIVDCDARLGAPDGSESEDIYAAIDVGLRIEAAASGTH